LSALVLTSFHSSSLASSAFIGSTFNGTGSAIVVFLGFSIGLTVGVGLGLVSSRLKFCH
jgi:ABC-type nitrate/sulfonate/bicarbonate transport system permease component